jgi:hypothetical protein
MAILNTTGGREPEVMDPDSEQRAGQVWTPDAPAPAAEPSPIPPPAGVSDPTGAGEEERQHQRNARRIAEREAAAASPIPMPAPVPQVPPPPVSFNLGGQGGGEGGGASSFARPGSAAARPFRSQNFATSRFQGGGPSERRAGFGAGAATVGGATPPVADFNASGNDGGLGEIPEDELAKIMAQVAGRYQGGR